MNTSFIPAQPISGAYAAPELCMLVTQPPRLVYQKPLTYADGSPVGWLVQVKHDGIRALCIGDQLVTREGTPFNAAMHCMSELQQLAEAYGMPMMFDGEYLEQGGLNATLSAFRSGRGKGCIFLFDAIPLADWRGGECNVPLKRRLDLLEAHLSRSVYHHIKPVPYMPMIENHRIMDIARIGWSAGQEGLVIKRPKSTYYRCYSPEWVKIKKVNGIERGLPVEGAMA